MFIVDFVVPPEDEHPYNVPIRRPYWFSKLAADGRSQMCAYVKDPREISWYWPTAEILEVRKGFADGAYHHIGEMDRSRLVPETEYIRSDPRSSNRSYTRTYTRWYPRWIPEEEEGDEFPIYIQ